MCMQKWQPPVGDAGTVRCLHRRFFDVALVYVYPSVNVPPQALGNQCLFIVARQAVIIGL